MTRASRRKHHIIYKTTCIVTGRWYIGLHSTDDLNDDYLGSGLRMKRSIKKYGKENHVREILEQLESRVAASNRETELITAELRADPLCLNCGAGGLGAVDRPPNTEESSKRRTAANLKRWGKEKKLRSEVNNVQIILTREEVLALLITAEGQLNKNATRAIKKTLATIEMPSRTREANVIRRWQAVYSAINNPVFPDLVEQINAYVHDITEKPKCKLCQKPTTFFRFSQPYATYCGASCQLKDPQQKNPVLTRWSHKYSHHPTTP